MIHIREGVRAGVGNITRRIYQYDLESNINQILSEQGTSSFGYDNLYRLTSATYPESNAANDESFAYDGVSNRTTHTQTDDEDKASEATLGYNNHNQLMQSTAADSTVTFTYNANGHTATKVENGTVTEYVYNHEERLIAVKINNVTVGEYAYNPNGMRVKKTVNGTTTYYLYNENGLAAEYDGSGNLIKEYHFHPQQTWMTEPLFQRTASNQIYYYQNDHLGTPQRMVASNGAVVWQASYTAFGEATIAATSTIENNLRFPGQYFDEENGLHHNYFRDYDPELGRYIQSDPIGLAGGINPYAYVVGNPLRFSDPTGECPWCINAVVGALLDIAIQMAVNGGRPECIKWDVVLIAAVAGAVNPFGFSSAAARVMKGEKMAARASNLPAGSRPAKRAGQRAKKHHRNGLKEAASWAAVEGGAEVAGNVIPDDKHWRPDNKCEPCK